MAEDAWNTRYLEHVVPGVHGRLAVAEPFGVHQPAKQITAFLDRKVEDGELDYVLRKQLWAYTDDRIAVHVPEPMA